MKMSTEIMQPGIQEFRFNNEEMDKKKTYNFHLCLLEAPVRPQEGGLVLKLFGWLGYKEC